MIEGSESMNPAHMNDHDLLIRVNTLLDVTNRQLGEYKQSTDESFLRLWKEKATSDDITRLSQMIVDLREEKARQFKDHEHELEKLEQARDRQMEERKREFERELEKRDNVIDVQDSRLRRLEWMGGIATGVIGILQVLFHFHVI